MIIGLSPEPNGYGSPQQNYLIELLSLKIGCNFTLVVPNHPISKIVSSPNVDTFIGTNHPWSLPGSIERAIYASRLVKSDQDILVLVNPASLLIFRYLKVKPFIVYLGLEPSIDHSPEIYEVFLKYAKDINLFIFPNEQRAQFERRVANLPKTNIFIVKNAKLLSDKKPEPSNARENSFIYAGNLEEDKVDITTLMKVQETASTKIFGVCDNRLKDSKYLFGVENLTGVELEKEVRASKFSLTLWKPTSFGRVNAAPNKVYSALAHGTPSVSFPYPEIVDLIGKYGCGIVSKDFTLESFMIAIDSALEMISTNRWDDMSNASFSAHKAEYNWEFQIQPVLNAIMEQC